MPQTNPKVTNIALNAKAGALILIAGTKVSGKVMVMEDPALNAGVPQGLTGFYMDPASKGNPQQDKGGNVAPVQQVWLANSAGQTGQAYQPIVFENRVHGGLGEYAAADGTPLLFLTSNSATPSGVLLVEWD